MPLRGAVHSITEILRTGARRLIAQTLVLARRDLVADRLAYRNRRDGPNAGALRAHYDSLLREFEARIEAIDAEIKPLIEACEPIARTVKALVAIPGIGLKTAAALVGLLPDLGSAGPKRIASLAGLAPHPNLSARPTVTASFAAADRRSSEPSSWRP